LGTVQRTFASRAAIQHAVKATSIGAVANHKVQTRFLPHTCFERWLTQFLFRVAQNGFDSLRFAAIHHLFQLLDLLPEQGGLLESQLLGGGQHFGRPVVDPAMQTELSVVLQQCGFSLADANSTNKPAIEISGEAFSAYGMQKGNLISCKSRIEIKARDIATGDILAVDRQTSVGVDIAEQTAAKTAMQNAADELAGRLLPKLVK